MGQTPVLKIIATSPGVTVDQKPVSVPQDVFQPGQAISVPQGGYVALINNIGEVLSYESSFVAKEVIGVRRFPQKVRATPSVPIKPRIHFLGSDDRLQYLFGDTLFLSWVHPAGKECTYHVSLADIYGDLLETIVQETTATWIEFPIDFHLAKGEPVEVHVIGEDKTMNPRNSMMVRPVKDRARLAADVEKYSTDIPDHLVVRAALFDLSDCYFDQMHAFHKLLNGRYIPTDPLLRNYFNNVVQGYSLDRQEFRR